MSIERPGRETGISTPHGEHDRTSDQEAETTDQNLVEAAAMYSRLPTLNKVRGETTGHLRAADSVQAGGPVLAGQ